MSDAVFSGSSFEKRRVVPTSDERVSANTCRGVVTVMLLMRTGSYVSRKAGEEVVASASTPASRLDSAPVLFAQSLQDCGSVGITNACSGASFFASFGIFHLRYYFIEFAVYDT